MRPEHLALFRKPGRPAVHPDGSWAVVPISRPDLDADKYRSRLWRLDLVTGALSPFAHGESDSTPVFSPDGRWLAFLRGDDDGKPQLAVLAADGGEPQLLTDHPLGISGRPEFSPDSTRIAYSAMVPETGRYGTNPDVGPGAEPPRLITDFMYRRDGAGFLLDRPQQVFVIDVPAVPDPAADAPAPTKDEDKKDTPVGARSGCAVVPLQVTTAAPGYSNPVWCDGDLLVLRADIDSLSATLGRVPATGGEVADIALPGVGGVTVDADGSLLLMCADLGADGLDFVGKLPALLRARLAGTELVDVTEVVPSSTMLDYGIVVTDAGVLLTRMRRGGVELLRLVDGDLQELVTGDREVYAAEPVAGGSVLVVAATAGSVGELSLISPDGTERVLTDLSARLRAEAGLFEPVEVEVAADDGYPVHGWVALPTGDGPHPVILLIHGGPYAAYERTFFDEVQTYAQAGYGVVFCNPRGSASYGEEHGRAIIGGFGQRDAADILQFLAGALQRFERLDGERVGVMGGSYGGYMTAWLTTQDQRWAGAIVERGFLDPVSFTGSSDIGWFFGGRYLGENPELVAAQSPMAHIEQVRTPTLVIHSENDWRCPVEQGQRWFVGLKRQGVPVEFLLFSGEGHELSRSGTPKHRVARFEHILRWWARYLPVTQ